MNAVIAFSRRIRCTPYEQRVHELGAKGFTVYNHMPLATAYTSVEADYWHLLEHVQLWDVSCERQIEVRGKDALRLVELSTPRDISKCRIGQCIYAPLCDEHGNMVNDPLILRLAEDRFWVSIADSGVLLWLKGLAAGLGMEVEVFEAEVSPCALQGPKADAVMQTLVDFDVHCIRFFRFVETEIGGVPVVLARSGWSGQGGYEIYLLDSSRGLELWDTLWAAGEAHNIRPGCPNLIERIESGLLSFGSDMTMANNIFECGLDRFVTLGKSADYIAREAIARQSKVEPAVRLVRLEYDGERVPALRSTWPVLKESTDVGYVTSSAYSPRLETNIAFSTVSAEHSQVGQRLAVHVDGESSPRTALVVEGFGKMQAHEGSAKAS